MNVLIVYEIAYKASKVTSRRAYRDFEKWVASILSNYKDAAVEHAARVHLFRLREQFSF